MRKKQLLATLVMLSLMQSSVYAGQKIEAEHETKKPYTEYMEFGSDDHVAFITNNAGGIYYNTWNFEQGALIDNSIGTDNKWDAINFDAGASWGIDEYTGIINIGKEGDRKKNFIVYAPDYGSVIEMNGGYGPEDDAQAILTIEGGTGANLQFYGGSNKDILHSVISMRSESILTINANTLYMEGKINGNDNGAGGITVYNDSHLDINLAGDFTTKTSNGITVLENGSDQGLGSNSTKQSSLNIDAENITIEAFSNEENNLNKDYNQQNVSDADVQGVGIYANTMKKGSQVDVDLNSQNTIKIKANAAGIYAVGNSKVNLDTKSQDEDSIKDNITIITKASNAGSNTIGVYAGGTGIGSSEVTLTSDQINILSNNKSVWASGDGGTINLNGAVNINANSSNSRIDIGLFNNEKETTANQHIAIVAGVVGEDRVETNHGEVNVNLKGSQNSQIIGDIVGARDGVVNVNSADYSGILTVYGDILAGNGGTRQDSDGNKINVGAVNIDLGKGGYFEGRVDDYQDANLKDALEFFDPHFTDGKVTQAGTVNLKMGSGSKWQVTGQSWVTTLDGNDSTIILNGEESGGYAVHIGKLTGNNTFVVNLNPDKSEFAEGDMIYVQDGTYSGLQTLKVANEEELLKNKDWDRIRFATVANAAGSAGDSNFEYGGSFGDTYTIKGRGIRNVDYAIEYVAMDEDTTSAEDNLAYNGGSEDLTAEKPGTKYNEETYNKTDEGQNSQYVYLARSNGTDDGTGDYTDSAKSIINMSRANYKNAIYMDRLNKRLGEARYINGEEEQGMWVRIRHDRIGMDGEFRSQNTMHEMGYDEKQDCDNGERRIGFAIDYMDGSTTYSDIMGKGETKRYGLWLYDTWLGDKGHYADYVAKWGHLSNDFDIHDKDSLDHVVGDYSNNVFSVSAEYGKKNDMGNNWYFEPQAQLQLARVTGAEYTTTTQDTKVKVDGINSLIGRAGFRLGRDLNENSTVYIKADLLHEFLGDQTITATDATGTLCETFENKGTWYDVGFGFATALGKNSYAFMDFEKSFGNDNDETYQVNAGVQWTF